MRGSRYHGALAWGACLILIVALAACGDAASTGDAPSAASDTADTTAEASPSEETSANPTASAEGEPSAEAQPPVVTWEEPVPFDGQPVEIVADDETWVAVGWGAERGPAAWTSADAVTWMPAEVPDPHPDSEGQGAGLGPTVRLGDSLLSYGTFIGFGDGRGVLGWRSADGATWEMIESDSPLFETGYLVRELVVGDPALVAIENQFVSSSGRIWRWTEETSWVETTPETAGTDTPSGTKMSDVVWADGRFVVVGQRHEASDTVIGTSWVSEDGETWSASDPDPNLSNVDLTAVAPIPGGGFAALGQVGSSGSDAEVQPLAFTSTDGRAWTPVEPPWGEAPVTAVDIVPVEGGLVAIGVTSDATHVSTSADGVAWTEPQQLESVARAGAAMGHQFVIVAYEDGSEGSAVVHRGTMGR
jgi:hypothetical protein